MLLRRNYADLRARGVFALPEVLTSADVAWVCGVSPRTACKLMDNRQRGLPPMASWRIGVRKTKDRRVRRDHFLQWLRDSGIALPSLSPIAWIGAESAWSRQVAACVDALLFIRVDDVFSLGAALATLRPLATVLDASAIGLSTVMSVLTAKSSALMLSRPTVVICPDDQRDWQPPAGVTAVPSDTSLAQLVELLDVAWACSVTMSV